MKKFRIIITPPMLGHAIWQWQVTARHLVKYHSWAQGTAGSKDEAMEQAEECARILRNDIIKYSYGGERK